MQRPDVAMTGYPPEGKVKVFGCILLVLTIADDHVRALASESRDDPLEALFFAYLVRTVDILDRKHLTQTVEEYLGQGWYQLGGGH